jgi:ribonuclease R
LLSELGGGRHQLKELRRVLRGLMVDGRVERFQGSYRISRNDGLLEGTFQRARGGAQVVLGSGDVLDVPDEEAVGGAEDGDKVLVHVRGKESRAAWVIHVLSPTRSEWVGIRDIEPTGGYVTPYRDDATWGIRVARGDLGGARDGDVVVVDLQTRRRGPPRGRVVEVLGAPEADFRAVVWHRRLPTLFPDEALREAEACPDTLDAREAGRRTDLRDKPFVTIDPATTTRSASRRPRGAPSRTPCG